MTESDQAADAVPATPAAPANAGGAVIPDFAEDARTIASFESARERFERAESQTQEDEIRKEFKRKRDALQIEISTAEALIQNREQAHASALGAYRQKYPKLVEKNRPKKPAFMQNLTSFGKAGKMYAAAMAASAELNDARSLRRRKEHDEEELDDQQRRALGKLEAALKEKAGAKEQYEKFLARPGNPALAKKVEAIKTERAAYAARLEAGNVPALEARDRYFAQINAVPLEPPFAGMAIVGVEIYGDLGYLIFRDRERKHFYRPYDARLEGLSDTIFDVYRIADRFEAKLHRREGKPMNLSDHLTEYLRDDEQAKSEARRIRSLLRQQRTLAPQPTDKSLMDLLSELAKTTGRFSG